jgi:hypothetical protein
LSYFEQIKLPENLIDSFSRLRVSSPVVQLSIVQNTAIRESIISEGEVSGTGTSSTYNLNRASTVLRVGTTVGLRRLRTKQAGLYQPGKSLLILFTFVLDTGTANVKKRVGYFDNSNGIFLQQNGTVLEWVLRSKVTGSVVETAIAQTNWNTDKFDGTLNGYNLDVTKVHIGFINLEWLGVGDVACGFIKEMTPIVSHVFRHPNAISNVYMSTANLFLQSEIERTVAGGTGTSNLEFICGSVINEGSIDEAGVTYTINRSAVYTTGPAFTVRPLMLIRLNPSYINARVFFTDISLSVSSNADFLVYLIKQPTYSGTVTPNWTALTNSSIEYDINPTANINITNADTNATWVGLGNQTNDIATGAVNRNMYLGSNYLNEPEVWAVAIMCNSNAETVPLMTTKLIEQI